MSRHVKHQDLVSRPVTGIMSSPAVAILGPARLGSALAALTRSGLRHLAVVDERGRCVGVVADRTIAAAWAADPMALECVTVAAMLVLTVGYQSVVVIPSLRSLSEAQVLSPVVLRPAARGETPVVPLDAGARFVSLSFEANVDPGVERLHYLIRASNSGAIVADGQTAAPVSGSSVLLIVPARRLERGTQYVAELRNAVDLTALIGEYRFTIAP